MLSLITNPHIFKVQFDVRLLLQFDNRLSICKYVLSLVSTGDGAGCVCGKGGGGGGGGVGEAGAWGGSRDSPCFCFFLWMCVISSSSFFSHD